MRFRCVNMCEVFRTVSETWKRCVCLDGKVGRVNSVCSLSFTVAFQVEAACRWVWSVSM